MARHKLAQMSARISDRVRGSAGNHRWDVQMDYSEDGYLGISQWQIDGRLERVLLSPAQLTALKAFTRRRAKKTAPR